ncbi:MAG: tRNA lysidine(34) synthetase TilS [Phycisphaerales bacterium]
MPPAPSAIRNLRNHPHVRRVLGEWRRLTGGGSVRDAERATLIACSGGADSSALAIALGQAPTRIVLAHVVHDLRPEDEALADRDATAALADRLSLEFVESRIAVRELGGNLEARARRERYRALEQLAHDADLPFVATGHHADDQLETLLMRLVRGAGARGMGGIAPKRRLGSTTLVRPMLGIGRAEGEEVCELAGWAWRVDETNRETSRLRAALRHDVIPALKRTVPGASERASATADACRDAGRAIELIAARAGQLSRVQATPDAVEWNRQRLRRLPNAVLGELVRQEFVTMVGAGADRLPRRTLARIVSAIRDDSGESRRFDLWGARIELTRGRVRMWRGDAAQAER